MTVPFAGIIFPSRRRNHATGAPIAQVAVFDIRAHRARRGYGIVALLDLMQDVRTCANVTRLGDTGRQDRQRPLPQAS